MQHMSSYLQLVYLVSRPVIEPMGGGVIAIGPPGKFQVTFHLLSDCLHMASVDSSSSAYVFSYFQFFFFVFGFLKGSLIPICDFFSPV